MAFTLDKVLIEAEVADSFLACFWWLPHESLKPDLKTRIKLFCSKMLFIFPINTLEL